MGVKSIAGVLKILAILGLLYFLVRQKWALSIVLAVCTVATAVLFLMPPAKFALTLWGTFTSYDTLKLLWIVAFIEMLSGCLREGGALGKMVESLRGMISDSRLTMAMLPALIGFLPMPGGALFSAPLMEPLADEAGLSPEKKTFVNYWFRHVWEYTFPLYPGLLLSATVLGVDIKRLITFQIPLSITAIVAGAIFGIAGIKRVPGSDRFSRPLLEQAGMFLQGFWPVLFIVVGIFVIPWQKILPGIVFDPLMVFLPVTVILFGWPTLGTRKFLRTCANYLDFRLPLTILAVLVFKDMINASGAVDQLSRTLQGWGVPPLFLFLVLPALIGYLTGITHSFVSVAFPLLMPFIVGTAGGGADLSKVQLAYTSGFIGVILSPVHLCLILSNDYFHADLGKVIKMLYLPVTLLVAVSLVIFYLGR
jgi:hypothetical protein